VYTTKKIEDLSSSQ